MHRKLDGHGPAELVQQGGKARIQQASLMVVPGRQACAGLLPRCLKVPEPSPASDCCNQVMSCHLKNLQGVSVQCEKVSFLWCVDRGSAPPLSA